MYENIYILTDWQTTDRQADGRTDGQPASDYKTQKNTENDRQKQTDITIFTTSKELIQTYNWVSYKRTQMICTGEKPSIETWKEIASEWAITPTPTHTSLPSSLFWRLGKKSWIINGTNGKMTLPAARCSIHTKRLGDWSINLTEEICE